MLYQQSSNTQPSPKKNLLYIFTTNLVINKLKVCETTVLFHLGDRAYALQFEDLPIGIKRQILTDLSIK